MRFTLLVLTMDEPALATAMAPPASSLTLSRTLRSFSAERRNTPSAPSVVRAAPSPIPMVEELAMVVALEAAGRSTTPPEPASTL
ncbi:hypothetical protein DSECCO2_593910 [anaerobic digester metagenome]